MMKCDFSVTQSMLMQHGVYFVWEFGEVVSQLFPGSLNELFQFHVYPQRADRSPHLHMHTW